MKFEDLCNLTICEDTTATYLLHSVRKNGVHPKPGDQGTSLCRIDSVTNDARNWLESFPLMCTYIRSAINAAETMKQRRDADKDYDPRNDLDALQNVLLTGVVLAETGLAATVKSIPTKDGMSK